MPDNPITENAPLDAEDWQIAFEPYAKHPILALALAQHLTALQDYAQRNPAMATAAINRAVESRYEHSEFRSVGLELFRATVQGTLAIELENLINQLGIRRKTMGNPVPRPKHLAAKLLAIRQHLGLSQFKMVVRLGSDELSHHRISEYEHGRRMPNLMTVLTYARAAGIPMEYLADDEVDLKSFGSHLAEADKTRGK